MDHQVAGAFIDDSQSDTYSSCRILGVRLRKFCLWHRLLLNAVNSPFMEKGFLTMYDLRVAVGICRLRAFQSRVRKPWLIPSLIYAGAILTVFWPKRWQRHNATSEPQTPIQRALQKRADAFLTYCGDYLQDPEYNIIPPELPGGRKLPRKTPRGRFDDGIEHFGELVSWGISERRAWELPLGQARIYRILARRAAGNDVDIMGDEEREFRRQMKEAQPSQNGST